MAGVLTILFYFHSLTWVGLATKMRAIVSGSSLVQIAFLHHWPSDAFNISQIIIFSTLVAQ